jgi:hypothetical protein
MAPVPDTYGTHLERISLYIARSLKSSSSSLSNSASSIISRSSALLKRDSEYTPGSGVTPPTSIPNNAVFALFGLIGAAFVITGIWFFFWARNGGFHFQEGDWDDYKSTVLRRKGPNGTTLSGATRTTDLGGGSVVGKKARRLRYKDVDDMESSIGTASEMSEVKSLRSGRKTRSKTGKSGLRGGDIADETTSLAGSEQPDDDVRAYRHEKPARVGGLNRVPDGSAFEGSTQDSHSDLLSNRQHTPTSTPTKKLRKDNYTSDGTPGIRHIQTTPPSSNFWSSSSKKESTHKALVQQDREDRIKAEARKLQEKGRAAGSGRRDFSYTIGDDASTVVSGTTVDEERRARRERRQSRSPEKKIPGSYTASEGGSDISGTKSYHHPIPGLSSSYATERRKERAGGYRRGRRDELSDSDGN